MLTKHVQRTVGSGGVAQEPTCQPCLSKNQGAQCGRQSLNGLKAALTGHFVKTGKEMGRLQVPSFRHADKSMDKSDNEVVQVEK